MNWRVLPVGAWSNIQIFPLSPATWMHRSTEHSYKNSFVHNTTFTRSNHVNDEMFLSFGRFSVGYELITTSMFSNR